ncbi:MAG: FixH family protein [Bryobacteraceae bacterium]
MIESEISPKPVRIGRATVRLRLSDAAGQPVRHARIALEADMSHPGMRPEFGAAPEVGPGRYQGQVAFTMAGDWVVLIHATLPGGQKLERQMEVNGVR